MILFNLPLSKRLLSAACLAGCVLAMGGCDGLIPSQNGEDQFLTRRVEQLEERVRDLESALARQGGGQRGGIATPSSARPAAPVAPVGAGPAASPVSASSPAAAASLQSDEDRMNILMLKAKQLEGISRADLPAALGKLGINASEVIQLQKEISGLEAERTQIAGGGGGDAAAIAEVDAKLDKLRYRLELMAEAVRQRIIDEGRAVSARLRGTPAGAEAEEGGKAAPEAKER